MSGAGTLSFGSGFANGFQMTDQQFEQERDREDRRAASAYAMAKDTRDYNFQVGKAKQDSDIAQQNANRQDRQLTETSRHNQVAESNARLSAQQRWMIHQDEMRDKNLTETGKMYLANFARAAENGDPIMPDLELEAQLRKAGKGYLAPSTYLDQNEQARMEKLSALENAAKSGDFRTNKAAIIDALNENYSDQIGRGPAVEIEGISKPVASKKLVDLKAGPGGKYVGILGLTYQDGTTDQREITFNRLRRDEDGDPVALHDVSDLMQDATARLRISRATRDPSVQQKWRDIYNQAAGQKPTPQMQNVSALQSMGVPQDQAVDRVFPDKNANKEAEMAGGIFKSAVGGLMQNPSAAARSPQAMQQLQQQAKDAAHYLSDTGKPGTSAYQTAASPEPNAAASSQVQEQTAEARRSDKAKKPSGGGATVRSDGKVDISGDPIAVKLMRSGDKAAFNKYMTDNYADLMPKQ